MHRHILIGSTKNKYNIFIAYFHIQVHVQTQTIATYEHNEVKRSIERKNVKTEVRKFNFKIKTSVNANLLIGISNTFTYMTIYTHKNKICGKIADFAIISITNTFLDDILFKYTSNIIHQSIVKLACTASIINT